VNLAVNSYSNGGRQSVASLEFTNDINYSATGKDLSWLWRLFIPPYSDNATIPISGSFQIPIHGINIACPAHQVAPLQTFISP